jgi:hypothetical protein
MITFLERVPDPWRYLIASEFEIITSPRECSRKRFSMLKGELRPLGKAGMSLVWL